VVHYTADSRKRLFGRASSADVGVHPEHEIHLVIGPVDFERNLVAQALVLGIANHPHDFDIELGSGVAAHSDMSSEGQTVFEVFAGELLVDDTHQWRAAAVGHSEIPALED